MQLKHFFQLIRWENLVLIALMQFLIKYYFFAPFNNYNSLSYSSFSLLVCATIIITASGYIINDIIDIKVDLINKPKRILIQKHFTAANAKKMYFTLTFIGLMSGIGLSIIIEKPIYIVFFISIILLLFIYSKFLKGKLLVGNILVSLLLSFSILILLIFDFIQPENYLKWSSYLIIHKIVIVYAFCAFLLNLTREIIKDVEDVNGDYNQNLNTYPIVYGRERAKKLALSISVITVLFLLFVIFNQFNINSLALIYLLVFVLIPLLYFSIKLYDSKTKYEYSHLSKVLKIIILTGILSIPLISNYFIDAI